MNNQKCTLCSNCDRIGCQNLWRMQEKRSRTQEVIQLIEVKKQ